MAAATDPSLMTPPGGPAGGRLPPQLAAFEALWGPGLEGAPGGGVGGGPSPELLAQHSTDLLCCAAACLYHDKLVPER